MPVDFRDGDTPVVRFDPRLELSPFSLFRMLDEGRPVLLIDARSGGGERTLEGAEPYPGDDWSPPDDRLVVLFDDDGAEALPRVERLLRAGHERVRLLFGGLELYEFSLDPAVVGERTFLVRRPGATS